MIDKNHRKEIASGDNNNAENFNNYVAYVGSTYGEKISDSYAFEEYISSKNVSEFF